MRSTWPAQRQCAIQCECPLHSRRLDHPPPRSWRSRSRFQRFDSDPANGRNRRWGAKAQGGRQGGLARDEL